MGHGKGRQRKGERKSDPQLIPDTDIVTGLLDSLPVFPTTLTRASELQTSHMFQGRFVAVLLV